MRALWRNRDFSTPKVPASVLQAYCASVAIPDRVYGAIDVGTNAVRLELARRLPDGSLEVLHQERDPVRPGEGVFKTGAIPPLVADRLIATLRRYSALCQRYRAVVRAVATSAVREARNKDEIVRRVWREAGLKLEVISGKEEARLICLGVLHGKPPLRRSLCVDIGGGSTEVASAVGEKPEHLWSVLLGAVQLTDVFDSQGKVTGKRLALMRHFALEALRKQVPAKIPRAPGVALGSSGTINAVVGFASDGASQATPKQLGRAVERLARMDNAQRKKHFDAKRADIVLAGAVILEAVAGHLGLEKVTAVDRGLRNGLLLDLVRRENAQGGDTTLSEAALGIGRRFYFDEPHSRQVTRLALKLFDDLAALHRLPAADRRFLEVAGLLHDIGTAVSYTKHHRHTQYLIQNADIPGLADRERELVGRVARYHRRSPPEAAHKGMAGLGPLEIRTVRKLSTLLRVADSLDCSHQELVSELRATVTRQAVNVALRTRGSPDLELWDVQKEAVVFRRVFGRGLHFQVEPALPRRATAGRASAPAPGRAPVGPRRTPGAPRRRRPS